MKKLNLVSALAFGLINAGVAYSPSAAGADRLLKQLDISVRGEIVARGCMVGNEGGSGGSFISTINDVSIETIKALANDQLYSVSATPATIELDCGSETATYANIKLFPISAACISETNQYQMTCDGINKSVGMILVSRWTGVDNTLQTPWTQNNDIAKTEIKTVKLAKGKGKLEIGTQVHLVKVKGKKAEPGHIAANYILQVWGA